VLRALEQRGWERPTEAVRVAKWRKLGLALRFALPV